MPYRRKNSGSWWISFDTPKGRATRSAKTENYDEAVAIENAARESFFRESQIPSGYRRCTSCTKKAGQNVYKPESEFTNGTSQSWCRECKLEWARRIYRTDTDAVAKRDENGKIIFDPDKIGMAIHQFITGQPLTVKLPRSKSISDSENQRRMRERIPRPSMVSNYDNEIEGDDTYD